MRYHHHHRKKIKAQSTMEYTMVVVCLVAALLGMQHYIKRAAQGRLRQAADTIGGQYDAHHITADVNYSITQLTGGETLINTTYVEWADANAEDGVVAGLIVNSTTTNQVVYREGYEELDVFPAGLFD